MTAWTSDELTKIGTVEELEIAPLRRDGTLQRPVPVWVVRLGDDLYVRSVNGRSAGWFHAAQTRHQGRIRVAGVEKDVTFVEMTGTTRSTVPTARSTAATQASFPTS